MVPKIFLSISAIIFLVTCGYVFWQWQQDQSNLRYIGNQTLSADTWLDLGNPLMAGWETIDRVVGVVVRTDPAARPWPVALIYSWEKPGFEFNLPSQFVRNSVYTLEVPNQAGVVVERELAPDANVGNFFQLNSQVSTEIVTFTQSSRSLSFLRNVTHHIPPSP